MNLKSALALLLSIMGVLSVFGSFTVVKPGNVGVIFNQLSGALSSAPQGFVFKIPFITNVQSYPISLRTYTMVARSQEGSATSDDSIDLPTKEGQHIKQDLSITYNTTETRAVDVFKNFKGADIADIENTFVRRTAITVAQNVAGVMSLSELISSGRDSLQNNIQKALTIELNKMGFSLDKVNLGASHLPQAIENQMQEKMAAQQQALQATYELQKQTTLAQAAVAKAHGEADSEVVRAEGKATANRKILETLSPLLIEYRKVEKWDGVQSQVQGGTPLINFQPSGKK